MMVSLSSLSHYVGSSMSLQFNQTVCFLQVLFFHLDFKILKDKNSSSLSFIFFHKPAMPSSLTHIVKLNKFLIHWLVKMGICFWMQHLMQIPHIKEWNIRNHSCICKTLENDSLNLNLPSPIYSQKAQISQKQQVSPASTPRGKPTLTEFLATRSVDLKNHCNVQFVFWEM